MMKIEDFFPSLVLDGFRVTSGATKVYNCIAWAATVQTDWFWPDDDVQSVWPDHVAKEATIDAFVKLYTNFGYEICVDAFLEAGFEKVAIYSIDGIPKHAARQLPSGLWTSKLGRSEDIEHTLRGLEGAVYGMATVFLKRPTKPE